MIHDIDLTMNKSFQGILGANIRVVDNITKSTNLNPLVSIPGKILMYPVFGLYSIGYWAIKNMTNVNYKQFCPCVLEMKDHYQRLINNGADGLNFERYSVNDNSNMRLTNKTKCNLHQK